MIYLAIDFDGTIADHKYPDIGKPVPGAFKWLKKLKENGAVLILWTMRSDAESSGPTLSEAVKFCEAYGVEFDFINENPQDWTESPKVYAHKYVDDAAVGCPLVENKFGRPYVDWEVVGPELMKLFD